MKVKNFIIYLIFLLVSMFNSQSDLEDYEKLKIENVSSIKREDLPHEFTEDAFRTVDEFIRKTKNLNYECALFFDYCTGEVLKFAKGINNNVKLRYNPNEFSDNHVASIHNHPKNAFGPPSGKNFTIFLRSFEDYELIVGRDGLWILKAKGTFKYLINEVREASEVFYILTLEHCENSHEGAEDIDKCNDCLYGDMLLKYINDKNINDIKLIKREYKND